MSGNNEPAGDLSRLYREAIRQHSSEPVGYRVQIDATHRQEEYNPQCGDRVEIRLRVAGGSIEAAAFDAEACAICMASASLLCSLAPGVAVAELQDLGAGLEMALKEPSKQPPHPRLQPLLGVRPYPSRVRCATLPWTAAQSALAR